MRNTLCYKNIKILIKEIPHCFTFLKCYKNLLFLFLLFIFTSLQAQN